jgi:hypothetical protein
LYPKEVPKWDFGSWGRLMGIGMRGIMRFRTFGFRIVNLLPICAYKFWNLSFEFCYLGFPAVGRWGGTDLGRGFSILVQDGYKKIG